MQAAGLADSDLLDVRYEGEAPHVLPYFLAIDEPNRSLVLAIRGAPPGMPFWRCIDGSGGGGWVAGWCIGLSEDRLPLCAPCATVLASCAPHLLPLRPPLCILAPQAPSA